MLNIRIISITSTCFVVLVVDDSINIRIISTASALPRGIPRATKGAHIIRILFAYS